MATFRFLPPRTPAAALPPSGGRPSAQAAAASADLIRQRARPRAADAILSATARAWFEAIPMRPRPEQLCARYPRVANRLALCWTDLELTERLFDDLLVDRRGGRKGFPTPVLAELSQLRQIHAARRGPVESDLAWSEVLVNP